jgi:hypothetical protein
MDRIARLLRGPRSRTAAAFGTIAAVVVVGAAVAVILAPDPLATPANAGLTPGGSASPSAVPTESVGASPAATTSEAPATAQPTGTPPPSAASPPQPLTAGVIQSVTADLRVRESADLDARVVATLSSGQQARTTASTVQADGYTWTDILLQPSGIRGWAAIADRSGTNPWLVSVADGQILVTTGDIADLLSPAIGVRGHAELVDPATGSRERLTRGAEVSDLAVAPDGARAAMAVLGQWIEVVTLDDDTFLELGPGNDTDTYPVVRDPRFSPDGLAIAYRAGEWDSLELQLAWYGSGAAPRLAQVGDAGEPAWSPDSSEIWTHVTDSDGENYDVVALGLHGGMRHVTDSPYFDGNPATAPDGRSIVYFTSDERGALIIATARPDGNGRRVLHAPEFLGGGAFAPLVWEPAGTRVAMRFDYTEDAEKEAPSRIEVIDVVSGEHTVFDGPGIDCGELTWSPTGTRLAMVCRSEFGAPRHLFVIGLDGSDVVDLGPAIEMDWAPVLRR